VGKAEGKGPLGRPGHRQIDNIKMSFKRDWIVWYGLDDLTLHGDQWSALVNVVMNIRIPHNFEKFWQQFRSMK
jgi:hypothetical protein